MLRGLLSCCKILNVMNEQAQGSIATALEQQISGLVFGYSLELSLYMLSIYISCQMMNLNRYLRQHMGWQQRAE